MHTVSICDFDHLGEGRCATPPASALPWRSSPDASPSLFRGRRLRLRSQLPLASPSDRPSPTPTRRPRRLRPARSPRIPRQPHRSRSRRPRKRRRSVRRRAARKGRSRRRRARHPLTRWSSMNRGSSSTSVWCTASPRRARFFSSNARRASSRVSWKCRRPFAPRPSRYSSHGEVRLERGAAPTGGARLRASGVHRLVRVHGGKGLDRARSRLDGPPRRRARLSQARRRGPRRRLRPHQGSVEPHRYPRQRRAAASASAARSDRRGVHRTVPFARVTTCEPEVRGGNGPASDDATRQVPPSSREPPTLSASVAAAGRAPFETSDETVTNLIAILHGATGPSQKPVQASAPAPMSLQAHRRRTATDAGRTLCRPILQSPPKLCLQPTLFAPV